MASSCSNITQLLRDKLREISRFKSNQFSERMMNSQGKAVSDLDIEPVVYMYENEVPVEVQIWDQIGINHGFNLKYYFTQNYL